MVNARSGCAHLEHPSEGFIAKETPPPPPPQDTILRHLMGLLGKLCWSIPGANTLAPGRWVFQPPRRGCEGFQQDAFSWFSFNKKALDEFVSTVSLRRFSRQVFYSLEIGLMVILKATRFMVQCCCFEEGSRGHWLPRKSSQNCRIGWLAV